LLERCSGVLGNFFREGGEEDSTNSVEERVQRERGSGGGSPLVRGSGGNCNLVQEISYAGYTLYFPIVGMGLFILVPVLVP
jgi:hypothetical protein